MGMISGGQLAVDALIEKGVRKVFSLSGGHIFPLYECSEGSCLEIFTTRHEQAAVFMAEAWGHGGIFRPVRDCHGAQDCQPDGFALLRLLLPGIKLL